MMSDQLRMSEVAQDLISALSGWSGSGRAYRFVGTAGSPSGAVSMIVMVDGAGTGELELSIEVAPAATLDAPAES